MRGKWWRAALLMAGCVIALVGPWTTGCTEAKLEPIPKPPVYRDDKLEVRGGFCTQKPETLVFPLRVLFVIDSSLSMSRTDPADPATGVSGRERAVRSTWTDLLDQGAEGVSIGVVRFSANTRSHTAGDHDGDGDTDYFTADPALLDVATQSLARTDRTTNYINALGEAYFEMREELMDTQDQSSLPLSKYVVVFLSDGIPDVDSGSNRENSTEQILDSVNAMKELAKNFRVGEFAFHTAFISSGQEAFDKRAQELLAQMAETGGGNFRSFPNGEELNFLFVDFTVLRRIFTLKKRSAINLNAILDPKQIPVRPDPPTDVMEPMSMDMGGDMSTDADMTDPDPRPGRYTFVDLNQSEYIECGEPMVDTDADGLSDIREVEIMTSPIIPDTDDDGLSDYLEWQLAGDGLDPLDPEDSSCYLPSPCVDANNDSFCDCILDTDADGICDCADSDVKNAMCEGDERCEERKRLVCADHLGHDCVDEDMDGRCDCPDADRDGRCDYDDRDGDGLHNCEEVFYGSAQNGNDSDADGLPDLVEVRFQTNPAKNDLQADLDSDQTRNAIEVLSNTAPTCNDSEIRSRTAYRYELRQLATRGDQTCYDFRVSNITLVPTAHNPYDPTAYPGNGWNRLLFYAGEVAFDDPEAFAKYRVACVMASYYPDGNIKNPPSGRVDLKEEDFVEVIDFDPDKHCKWPSGR